MMLRTVLAMLLILAACAPAPSPLYVGGKGLPVGGIPRDARGEPVMAEIPPAPLGSVAADPVPVLPPR